MCNSKILVSCFVHKTRQNFLPRHHQQRGSLWCLWVTVKPQDIWGTVLTGSPWSPEGGQIIPLFLQNTGQSLSDRAHMCRAQYPFSLRAHMMRVLYGHADQPQIWATAATPGVRATGNLTTLPAGSSQLPWKQRKSHRTIQAFTGRSWRTLRWGLSLSSSGTGLHIYRRLEGKPPNLGNSKTSD